MQKEVNSLYEKIKDKISKKDFLDKIKLLQKESDDLLDEYTIALLLLDEMGENTNISKISEIKPNLEFTIKGKITEIISLRTFTRKKGSQGKVANLEITDETGSCNLVLWDNDVKLLEEKKIQKNTFIKIINGYVKDGYNGIEINVGKYGMIEIIKENFDKNISKEEQQKNSIKGEIILIKPTRAFFKNSGKFGFVTDIKIKEKENEKQITVWDEKVKEIQDYKIGDKIKIENIDNRSNKGKKELHLNGSAKISRI